MADGTASTSTSTSTPAPSTEQQPLVMQIIVDRELVKQPGWTRGPLMAQSAHAALAACHISSTSPNTTAYLGPENLAHMHKIVLQTPSDNGKTTLTALSERLAQARKEWEATREGEEVPLHYLWIEQPENIPTCLALAPNRKPPAVKKILNKCSLLRD
ncbi:uncharacterized protein PFL1_04247 [Pseudozyma flocculosa PF-1]|uniref:peptidyl-tRNA hydrolase n=2 Tax=Pseudozyma flocculosa TaxID=84751 RepID=A0A5C3EUR9_9BASI|nr:uncharacterized protein PFL1_04247 [Pseudozyma flocculosa PF-1]EPQ28420.1 hypothetical protein PFL1_04247 [Pseudozyma flocculosa PF-1]SPO35590.1 uncharacterized protein PSFLO_01061 [Pseudozyma flocculosa]